VSFLYVEVITSMILWSGLTLWNKVCLLRFLRRTTRQLAFVECPQSYNSTASGSVEDSAGNVAACLLTCCLGQSTSFDWAFPTLLFCQSISAVLFGRISDFVGRRWIFVGGNGVAFIGFLTCGRVSEPSTIVGMVSSSDFLIFQARVVLTINK
jgi:MFS family permease